MEAAIAAATAIADVAVRTGGRLRKLIFFPNMGENVKGTNNLNLKFRSLNTTGKLIQDVTAFTKAMGCS